MGVADGEVDDVAQAGNGGGVGISAAVGDAAQLPPGVAAPTLHVAPGIDGTGEDTPGLHRGGDGDNDGALAFTLPFTLAFAFFAFSLAGDAADPDKLVSIDEARFAFVADPVVLAGTRARGGAGRRRHNRRQQRRHRD